LMTLFTRRGGTEMNRDTVGNLAHGGFRVDRIESVFMDIILSITASKASSPSSEPQAAGRTAPIRANAGHFGPLDSQNDSL
jgi:hypothetical protein